MKNNLITSGLLGALLLSTLATAAMVYKWDSYYRHLRVMEPEIAKMSQSSTVIQQLFAESAEYAKTTGNKDMTALLNSGPTSKPAAAPAK
jgi:hypothetical protein